MKVIDLLNKIANEEDVPEKIVIDNTKLVYNEDCCLCLQDYYVKEEDNNATWEIWSYNLNNEVEIIEEDKKIEKLYFSVYEMERVNREVLEKIEKKFNEIIDYMNKDK